jgi:hypothetical protein
VNPYGGFLPLVILHDKRQPIGHDALCPILTPSSARC